MNKQVQLSVFQFQEAFDVRVILINDDPWFIASDLAKVLEYTHVPHMVRMCDDDEKGVQIVDTLGGQQKTTVISEPGLYRIMAASRSERAKPFQRWLFHTVLPTIRRTGSYTLPVPQAPSTQPTQDLRWQIPDVIAELVAQGVSAKGTLYNRLYRRFNVNSYKDIPADQSQAAVDYLKRMAHPSTKKASLTINDGEHYFVVKDGVVVWEKVLKPHCNDIPSNALKDPALMLEHIRQVVGEFVGKQALPAPKSRRRIRSREDLSFTARDAKGHLINWVVPSRGNDWHEHYGIGEIWFNEIVELARHNPEEAYCAMKYAGQHLIRYLGHGHEDGFFDRMARWALTAILTQTEPKLPFKLPELGIPPREGMDFYLAAARR